MKAIAIKTNSKGKKFALVSLPTAFAKEDSTIGYRPAFAVFVLCENYAGHVHGGIARTWRVAAKDMTREAAEALFNKRAAR